LSSKIAFVFAGAHKTATTALQQACFGYSGDLLKSNILFPSFATGYKQVTPNHTYLIRACFGADSWSRKRLSRNGSKGRSDLSGSWTQVISSSNNLLLIGEGTCTLDSSELLVMRASLESAGYEVKPFFCVRSPSSYLRSVVQQRVKGQFLILSPDCAPNIKLLGQLQKLLAAWPDTTLLTFEQACDSEGGPVEFYLRHLFPPLPVDLLKSMAVVHSNPSGSDQAVRLASYLHASHPRSTVPHQIKARRAFILALFRRLAGDPFRLLPTDLDAALALEEVRNQTLQINEILADRVDEFVPYSEHISYGAEPAPWNSEVFQSLKELLPLCPVEWIDALNAYVAAAYPQMTCIRTPPQKSPED
jgi:hypothetical protein